MRRYRLTPGQHLQNLVLHPWNQLELKLGLQNMANKHIAIIETDEWEWSFSCQFEDVLEAVMRDVV